MARVVLEHLSKTFKGSRGAEVHAVKDASLTVEDQDLLVLVGPSGCGKSTVLRMIAGLEEPSGGTISIDGEVVNRIAPKDRDIAMVFQNYALYPHMTVYQNMAFGLKLRKFPKPEIERRVSEAAEILGLMPYLDRLPRALSGGERQRVAVGRAIVRKPKVFLLDEPLSNLDAPMRLQLRTEISKLHTRLHATMIYVTHDQVEAMTLGDRIAVMREGVIQQSGDPMTVYTSPVNLFVAGFVGSPPMNFFRGTLIEKGYALFFLGPKEGESARERMMVRVSDDQAARLRSEVGKNFILGLRPDNIRQAPFAEAPRDNIVTAKIEVVEPLGAETFLYLTTGAQSFVVRISGEEKVEVNQAISLMFDMRQAHFFDPTTGLERAF